MSLIHTSPLWIEVLLKDEVFCFKFPYFIQITEIPSGIKETNIKILQALFAFALMVILTPNFGVKTLITDEFGQRPLWEKYLITWIAVFSGRLFLVIVDDTISSMWVLFRLETF